MLHRERNSADNEKIEYRFGINVGDITEDSGDTFGDSVNIAARLEALSVLGGLCVSDIVYQIIQDKITEPFKDLGSQRVKNLSRPIRVWQ
jgi:class 3 adenylate cyclase